MANPQKENGFTPIANEIMEALAKIRINGEARQMLDVIIRKTYGFQKKEDKISTSQFTQFTGLPNFAIHKARKKLAQMNIITITQKGNSQILTYSIQKDYEKWRPLPKKVTVTQKGSYYNPKRSQTVTQKAIHKRKKETSTKETVPCEKAKSYFSPAQNYFYLKYKEFCKKDYIANFGKDGAIFKELNKLIKGEDLIKLIDKFFESDDDFIRKSGWTIGIFQSQINKLQKPEIYQYLKKE